MAGYSDWIIYADESGSPNLTADAADFPIFVLVFLMVRKTHYTDDLVPALQKLKFQYVGHDQLIFHERDIRRQSGAFSFLQADKAERIHFLKDVSALIDGADIQLVCAIIDKTKLASKYPSPWSPYDLALTFCMERAAKEMRKHEQLNTKLHVVFEARGPKEDRHLELEFRRIAAGKPRLGRPSPLVQRVQWQPIFADKRSNSAGLQIADLAARPLGLGYLKPDQENRAIDILKQKCVFPHPKVFP